MKHNKKGKTRKTGRRAKKHAAVTNKERRKRSVIGEAWTEPMEVAHVQSELSRKSRVNVLFAWAFLVLLFAHTASAMRTNDHNILKESLDIVRAGLACVALWAGGKALLKVASGWRDYDQKGS